jgi:hypothetical protein
MISLSPKRLSLRAALRQSISTFPKGLDSRACPGARLSFPLDMRYRVGVRSRLISLRFTLSGLPSAVFLTAFDYVASGCLRQATQPAPACFWILEEEHGASQMCFGVILGSTGQGAIK